MKRTTISLLAVILLVFVAMPINVVGASPPGAPTSLSDSSSEYILVKFKPGADVAQTAEVHRQLGGKVKKTIPEIGVQVVEVPKGQAKDKAKAYSSNPRVEYAEPDFVAEVADAPDDPLFANQENMVTVQAPQAWEVTTGSTSINVAILDTGVDQDHPDLASKIISNVNFSDSPTVDDVHGHGTHVAGIAAASTNNGIGVAGLGYDATIMNVKVMGDTGSGAYSWIAAGIVWAADNGAEIINMSLGGSAPSSILEDAIDYAWSQGVVVVAAAGNSGNDLPSYPAYYGNCIAVAATDGDGARVLWSNYGDWVDVAAPGLHVYSTLRNSSYARMSGTSMASPHVAGLAALVFTTVSDTNGDGKLNDEVRSRIEANCDDIGVEGIGSGRINAARAVGDATPVLPGSIAGQATDAEDASPIAGATVTAGSRATTTDVAGEYVIVDVPPDTYQVTASKSGYESSSVMVTVSEGNTVVADLSLTRIIVPGSITGTVTDAETGSVIAGAAVTAGTRTTTTDTSGEYTIADVPPGTYEVSASKAGYESSAITVTVSEGNTVVADLSLMRIIVPGSIAGSVTDTEDGSAIAGATVTDGTRTTTADAAGEYVIADVPPGTYQVTAGKSGYHSSSLTVTVSEGNTAVADLTLTRIIVPGTITGTVTDAEDGSPIAGATVGDGTRTTITDAAGEYVMADVPPGTYEVTASKEGYESSFVTVTVLEGNTAVADLSLVRIIVPGTITGMVTDAEDGSPLAGATVTAGTRTTTTDTAGEYVIADVAPGSYGIVASKEGYESSSLMVTVLEGATAVADLSLMRIIVPGSITGTITSAEDGSPIVGVTVTDGTRTTTTDVSGGYNIANVPPGTYQVTASKSGYHSSSVTVTVSEGNTVVADLSLTRIIVPGSITGTVTDADDGSRIAGATVTAGTRMTTTDASGEYSIADILPNTYQVTATKSGYYGSSLTVSVFSGGTALANFSLNEIPGVITGTVTNAKDGSTIAGVTVTDGTRTTTTDIAGSYTIANVPPGSYQVTASKEGYVTFASSVTVVSGATAMLNFSLTEKPPATNPMWVDNIHFVQNGKNLFIEVSVVSASGALSGAEVNLSLEYSSGEIWNFIGTTNDPGWVKFKLGKAPAGDYVITVADLRCTGFVWDLSEGVTAVGYALSR